MTIHKDLRHLFKHTDFDYAITKWRVDGSDEHRIYLTLSDDRQQKAFMFIGDKTYLIDFKLSEKDGQLIYSDLNFMKDYVVDLSDPKRLRFVSVADGFELFLTRVPFEGLPHRL